MTAVSASELFEDNSSNVPVSPGGELQLLQLQTHSSKTSLSHKGGLEYLTELKCITVDLLPPSGDCGS